MAGNLLLGEDLKLSLRKLTSEIQKKDIKADTVSDATTAIIWRFTRIGFLRVAILITTVLISIIPIALLFNQNKLINTQNELFLYQNNRIDEQTNLFKKQNEKIDLQNSYFAEQTTLFENQVAQVDQQNKLVKDQNRLVRTQTEKLQQQNILSESERRSSLVFLMSNILDKMDEELKKNEKRTISKELIARIIALSNSLKPYYFFENNQLIKQPLSPERGQLFLAIVKSGIDPIFTQEQILNKSNFSYSDLREANLRNLNISSVNLSHSNFSEADLYNTAFQGTSLSNCNFKNTDLKKAYFSYSDLREVIFDGADLRDATLEFNTGLNKNDLLRRTLTNKQTIIE